MKPCTGLKCWQLAGGEAKWIGEARDAELKESDDDKEAVMVVNDQQHGNAVWKWKPLTLALLFSGKKPPRSRLFPEEIDAES